MLEELPCIMQFHIFMLLLFFTLTNHLPDEGPNLLNPYYSHLFQRLIVFFLCLIYLLIFLLLCFLLISDMRDLANVSVMFVSFVCNFQCRDIL